MWDICLDASHWFVGRDPCSYEFQSPWDSRHLLANQPSQQEMQRTSATTQTQHRQQHGRRWMAGGWPWMACGHVMARDPWDFVGGCQWGAGCEGHPRCCPLKALSNDSWLPIMKVYRWITVHQWLTNENVLCSLFFFASGDCGKHSSAGKKISSWRAISAVSNGPSGDMLRRWLLAMLHNGKSPTRNPEHHNTS